MNAGLYVVLVRLRRQAHIRLGAGSYRLSPGWYAYTGSARRGLDARVARHLAATKNVRWHIDHLTTHPAATVLGAVLVEVPDHGHLTECRLNQWVGRHVGGDVPVAGFGAGDCRSACPAHLWLCTRPVTPEGLAAALAAAELSPAGLGLPRVVRDPRDPERRPDLRPTDSSTTGRSSESRT